MDSARTHLTEESLAVTGSILYLEVKLRLELFLFYSNKFDLVEKPGSGGNYYFKFIMLRLESRLPSCSN